MKHHGPNPTLLDLGKYDMVMARCPCGHRGPVKPSAIPRGFDVSRVPIWQLPLYLKCTVCGEKRARCWVMTR